MIAFEVELVSEEQGLFCPSFICDFCLAKIKGAGGQVLIPEVRVPAGIAIGARFQADVQVFHLHEDCLSPFVQERVETNGADFSYRKIALRSYMACILTNLVTTSDDHRQRIFHAVEDAVEAECRS